MNRRNFVKTAGAAAAVGAAGCMDDPPDTRNNTTTDPPDTNETITDDGPDSTVGQDGNATNMTGRSEANVEVGAGDNGFRFDPADIIINPGTTVVWTWTGNGGQHNVVEADGTEIASDPAFESELTSEEGFEFTHTFEESGTHDYVCEVHINQGMIGSVEVVGDDGEGD